MRGNEDVCAYTFGGAECAQAGEVRYENRDLNLPGRFGDSARRRKRYAGAIGR